MSTTVLHRLRELLVDNFGVEEHEVVPEATFAQLDLDSLGIVEFAMVAEKEFGIVLAEDDVTPKASVADALSTLAAKGVVDG
ncbi:phosphopantetheine-binding protein [Actinophytocola sediminis]